CCATGCPMPGSITQSTNGSTEWYCGWHFGQAYADHGAITARIRNRLALIEAAQRLANYGPGMPVPDTLEPFLRRHNRLALAASVPGKRITARTLGLHILAVLGQEIAAPQRTLQASPDTETGTWVDTRAAVDALRDALGV